MGNETFCNQSVQNGQNGLDSAQALRLFCNHVQTVIIMVWILPKLLGTNSHDKGVSDFRDSVHAAVRCQVAVGEVAL